MPPSFACSPSSARFNWFDNEKKRQAGDMDTRRRRRTVADLRPKPGLALDPSLTVAEAARKMLAANSDCALVVSQRQRRAQGFALQAGCQGPDPSICQQNSEHRRGLSLSEELRDHSRPPKQFFQVHGHRRTVVTVESRCTSLRNVRGHVSCAVTWLSLTFNQKKSVHLS